MSLLARLIAARHGISVLGMKGAEALLGAAMTVYFANILGPETFGYFAFGLATVTLFAIPIKNGASTLITKQVAIATEHKRATEAGAFLAVGLRIAVAFGLLPLALAWGTVLAIAPDNQFLKSVAVAFLALPFLNATGVMEGVLRGGFQPKTSIIVGTVLVPALTLLAAFATARHGQPIGWKWATGLYVASTVAVSVIAAVWAGDRLLALLAEGRANRPSWGRWLHTATPFMIVTGLLVFNRQIDVILLGVMAGERDTGIYRLSAQAAVLVTFGVQAIGHLYAPHFAAAGSRNDIGAVSGHLKKSVVFSMLFGLGALAMLIVFGDEIIETLAGPEYLPGYPVMILLCAANLAVAANGALLQAIYMQGHQSRAARIFAATAVVSVLANAALIPLFGIYGAAIATSLSIILWSLGLRWLGCRTWGLHFVTLSTRSDRGDRV